MIRIPQYSKFAQRSFDAFEQRRHHSCCIVIDQCVFIKQIAAEDDCIRRKIIDRIHQLLQPFLVHEGAELQIGKEQNIDIVQLVGDEDRIQRFIAHNKTRGSYIPRIVIHCIAEADHQCQYQQNLRQCFHACSS